MLLLVQGDGRQQRSFRLDDVLDCFRFREFLQLMDPVMALCFHVESNRFHPDAVRCIHRQYLQLDRDKNGLLTTAEMQDYGKKKAFNPVHQTPTHDLTTAFLTQVFAETTTFAPHDEMDYKAYVDFTLRMSDKRSLASLRVWMMDGHRWRLA